MESSSDPALHGPREAPSRPKVRIEPRQVSKPQAEKERGVALGANASPAPRILRFECPACFGMLTVAPGAAYDGSPAPCPLCRQQIIGPRVAEAANVPEAFTSAQAPEKKAVFRPDRQRADFHLGEGSYRRVD